MMNDRPAAVIAFVLGLLMGGVIVTLIYGSAGLL
jgi:hypothetical protein